MEEIAEYIIHLKKQIRQVKSGCFLTEALRDPTIMNSDSEI